jgi:hypothetical protein
VVNGGGVGGGRVGGGDGDESRASLGEYRLPLSTAEGRQFRSRGHMVKIEGV